VETVPAAVDGCDAESFCDAQGGRFCKLCVAFYKPGLQPSRQSGRRERTQRYRPSRVTIVLAMQVLTKKTESAMLKFLGSTIGIIFLIGLIVVVLLLMAIF
jgi:hypothetical protein